MGCELGARVRVLPCSRQLPQTTVHERWRLPLRYLHRCRRNEVAIWDLLSVACLMACPGWVAASCPALGVRCESFEDYLRHGAAGFGGHGCGSPQQKVLWPKAAWEGPRCSFLTVPFGDPWVICGDGQHQSQRAGDNKTSLPTHLDLVKCWLCKWLQWWEVDGFLALLLQLSCMCWPAWPGSHLETGQKAWEGTLKGYKRKTDFLDH